MDNEQAVDQQGRVWEIGDPVTIMPWNGGVEAHVYSLPGDGFVRVADFDGNILQIHVDDVFRRSVDQEKTATYKNRQKPVVYKALKNYLHNTLGFSRAELAQMVRDAIKLQVKDSIERYVQTNKFREEYYRQYEWHFKQNLFEIKLFIAQEIAKQYKVTITPTNEAP